jgi:hypothetical protein
MIIDPKAASVFIADYTRLLVEAHRLANGQTSPNVLQVLAFGRGAIRRTPALLGKAVTSLEHQGERLSPEFRRAVDSLRLTQWIYLRDTTKYSIFVDSEGDEAYGVVGLTGPIRSILGGASVTFRAGVVEYLGKYVCDGILENHMWLGANYKRDFNARFSAIKKEGRFRAACEP